MEDHFSVQIPLPVLVRALGGNTPPPLEEGETSTKLTQDMGHLSIEFVVLSHEEISQLDPDEKSGVVIGNCIFIADTVPENFVPLVAANLRILAMLKDDNPISKLLQASKMDIDTEKHWTANILDISLAEIVLNEKDFKQYLEWRRKIERTDFFQDPNVGHVLNERLSQSNRNRTLHPIDRGRYAKMSWTLSGALEDLGRELQTKLGKDMKISNVDIIFRNLAKDGNFDPNKMLELLKLLRTKEGLKKNRIAGGSKIYFTITIPENLEPQAYLLTEDAQGHIWLLKPTKEASNTYRLNTFASRTIGPLEDRIAYFARAALHKKGVGSEVIAFLKTVATEKLTEQGSANGEQKSISSPSEGIELISEEEARVGAQIERIDDLLAQYEKIEDEFLKLSDPEGLETVKIVPKSLEDKKNGLKEARDGLLEKMAALKRDKDKLLELSKLLDELNKKSGALLEVVSP